MAEVKEEEQSGKGGLIKILLFSLGAILLLCIGLGIGYFLFGGEPETDPSQEVNQIIEGESNKKAENKEEETEGEEVGEDGIIKKNVNVINMYNILGNNIQGLNRSQIRFLFDEYLVSKSFIRAQKMIIK